MKKILLSITCCICALSAFGQDNVKWQIFTYAGDTLRVPTVNGKIVYSVVFKSEGSSADDIYASAKIAIADMFVSANSVVQLDDAQNKTIVAKGRSHWVRNSEAVLTIGFDVKFTLKIECRDQRYRITIYDFTSEVGSGAYKFEVDEEIALNYGVRKDKEVKKDRNGLSLPAWEAVSKDVALDLKDRIEKNRNTSIEDW